MIRVLENGRIDNLVGKLSSGGDMLPAGSHRAEVTRAGGVVEKNLAPLRRCKTNLEIVRKKVLSVRAETVVVIASDLPVAPSAGDISI